LQALIRAIVDTDALRHNLQRVRSLAPASRIMAVIKANAYGHGLVPAARALAATDGYAVARPDEGLALRAAGLTNRVLLLEGVFTAEQLDAAVQQRFELMVHSVEQLQLLEQRSSRDALRVWIKIDTGMNRLGFRSEDFAAAHARLTRIPGVAADPTLVTHLASADDLTDAATPEQVRRFEAVTQGLPGERSLANSAGVLGWPGTRGDWVRPGLMLYGASPFASGRADQFGLRPVMTLQSEVIAVKRVLAGEAVGYGGTWRADRQTRIAIAAAGYGDGYPRNTAAGTPVTINGQRAPLVGRVSMDMVAIDISGLPSVAVGDPVVLWGAGVPVEEIAQCAGTIPYELLCGVSQRVQHEFSSAAISSRRTPS
jgi:alanine racemase